MANKLMTLKILVEGDTCRSEFSMVQTGEKTFMLENKEDYIEIISSLESWLMTNFKLSSKCYTKLLNDQAHKILEEGLSNQQIDSIRPFDQNETMNLIENGANQQHLIEEFEPILEEKSLDDSKVNMFKTLLENNDEEQKGLRFEHFLTYNVPGLNAKLKLKFENLDEYLTSTGDKKVLYYNGEVFYDGFIKDYRPYGKKIKFYHEGCDQILLEVTSDEDNYLDDFNGDIKIYFPDGQVKFEGKQVNGKREGFGKEWHYDGYLRYAGQYHNGGYHGDSITLYNSNGYELIENTKFDSGKISDGELEEDIRCFDSYYSCIGNASYKNGLQNNSEENKCDVDFTTRRYDYYGGYLDGFMHGDGYICDLQNNDVKVFEGEWKNGLPFRNNDNPLEEGRVRLNDSKNGNRVFEGQIKKATNGWIYGKGSFYHYEFSDDQLYEGMYQCPTISSLLFMTPGVELLEYKEFMPIPHFLKNDDLIMS